MSRNRSSRHGHDHARRIPRTRGSLGALLHRVTGASYANLGGAMDYLDEAEFERLTALAREILTDMGSVAKAGG